jgi:hypothetical protein
MSAFAGCGHACRIGLGSIVPILLQNDFGPPRAEDFFKIRRKCAMLIQKCILSDSIVSRFYSTDDLRRLLQQYRHIAAERELVACPQLAKADADRSNAGFRKNCVMVITAPRNVLL